MKVMGSGVNGTTLRQGLSPNVNEACRYASINRFITQFN